MPFARLMLVCLVTAAWAVSFGIGTQATSHWLKQHDASDTLVGVVHAAYYLGVAGAAFGVPRMTRRIGLGTTSLGMFLSAVSLAVFPFANNAVGWILMRGISGAGCALSLIPMEAYLSHRCAPERRSETFSYYAVALTVAGAAGMALGLEGFNPDGLLVVVLGQARNGFFLAAASALIGSIIAQQTLARDEWDEDPRGDSLTLDWKKHVLSLGGAWGQGFLEGGMLAFLSMFLVNQGLTTSAAGVLMGVAMIGVIAFQVPVGWIADRCGQSPTLLVCYAVTIVALFTVPWCTSPVWLGVWLFLFGACSGAMYPLGLSLLSDGLPASSLARAYAWYLSIECIGSPIGAASMGWARDRWGGSAMFFVGAIAIVGVVALWIGVRLTSRRRSAPQQIDRPMRRAA